MLVLKIRLLTEDCCEDASVSNAVEVLRVDNYCSFNFEETIGEHGSKSDEATIGRDDVYCEFILVYRLSTLILGTAFYGLFLPISKLVKEAISAEPLKLCMLF